jgi:hypothetical protein
MAKKVKLPADPNKKAKAILDLITGEDEAAKEIDPIKAAAAALGRRGDLWVARHGQKSYLPKSGQQ